MAFTTGSCARGFIVLALLSIVNESAAASDELNKYTWILVVAGFLAFFAAYGIGANDVANAYATSVGAKSLTVRQAVCLAAVFEFLGAVTMGSSVAKTMRKGIADVECFDDNPGLLMWGMTCVILAVGIWLLLASYLEMPVSTTHSCVGGIVGMTVMSRGGSCVVWNGFDEPCTFDTFPCASGVTAIVISWVLSPVASAVCAAILYCFTYHVSGFSPAFYRPTPMIARPAHRSRFPAQIVLKNPATSFERAKYAFPIIVGFTVGVNACFFVLKGTKAKAEELGTDDIVQAAKEGNLGPVALVGAISMASATAIAAIITPKLVSMIKAPEEQQHAAGNEIQDELGLEMGGTDQTRTTPAHDDETKMPCPAAEEALSKPGPAPPTDEDGCGVLCGGVGAPPGAESADEPAAFTTLSYVTAELNKDAHEVLRTDMTANAIHENVKRHDPRCEEMFKYVQVFTAIVDSFSHGANDVANAMGPFSAVYITWKRGEVTSKEDLGDDMYWILAIGGAGIVVGLALYGYKIMSAIGVKLTAITPSRGYCIELGAAFVIIYGTSKGWPLSTTHCQIGATVGVGLFEGAQGVNVRVLLKCVFGWVITLIVVGITSALLVGPNPNPDKDVYCDYEGQDWLSYIDDANITAYVNSQQL